jgi:hypothetical protein
MIRRKTSKLSPRVKNIGIKSSPQQTQNQPDLCHPKQPEGKKIQENERLNRD